MSWLKIAGFLPTQYQTLHFLLNKTWLFVNKNKRLRVVQSGLFKLLRGDL